MAELRVQAMLMTRVTVNTEVEVLFHVLVEKAGVETIVLAVVKEFV